MKVTFRKTIARGNKQFKQGETYVIGDSVAKDYIQRGFCFPFSEVKDEFAPKPKERTTKEDKEAVKVSEAQAEKVVEPKEEPKKAKKRGRPRKKKD